MSLYTENQGPVGLAASAADPLFLPDTLQDMGVRSLAAAHSMLADGEIYLETRSGAAQVEGNIHDMHSYKKERW